MAIELKRKEAKTLTFTVKDSSGVVMDVSDPTTVEFVAKTGLGGTTIISKNNAAFDKTDAVNGVVKVNLSTTDTDFVGPLIGELKISFSASDIDKSDYIKINIKEAVSE